MTTCYEEKTRRELTTNFRCICFVPDIGLVAVVLYMMWFKKLKLRDIEIICLDSCILEIADARIKLYILLTPASFPKMIPLITKLYYFLSCLRMAAEGCIRLLGKPNKEP